MKESKVTVQHAQWKPEHVMQELEAAKEVRGIKMDIRKNGFQPLETYLDEMNIDVEKTILANFVPQRLMAVPLQRMYTPGTVHGVAAEFVQPLMARKEIEPGDAGIAVVNNQGKQWLIMPKYIAVELMKNLANERTVSSHATPSLQ